MSIQEEEEKIMGKKYNNFLFINGRLPGQKELEQIEREAKEEVANKENGG
jgi:hypothetical protein